MVKSELVIFDKWSLYTIIKDTVNYFIALKLVREHSCPNFIDRKPSCRIIRISFSLARERTSDSCDQAFTIHF